MLALDHLIDALPDPDMMYRVREPRPKNITDAEINSSCSIGDPQVSW